MSEKNKTAEKTQEPQVVHLSVSNQKKDQKFADLKLSRYTENALQYQTKKTYNSINNAEDNKYPEYLNSLYNNSPTHKACINDLVLYTVGKGLRAKNPAEQALIDHYFGRKKIKKIVFFNELHAEMTIEIIINKGGDKIAQINPTLPSHWRVLEMGEDDEIHALRYKTSWIDKKVKGYEDYPVFNSQDPFKYAKSVFYRYNPGTYNVPYGRPGYMSASDFIEMEVGVARSHNTGVQNGMSPSMIMIKQSSGNAEADQEDAMLTQGQLAGPAAFGKFLTVYTDGGTTQPPQFISPSLNGMDKVYDTLYEKAESGILKGHSISSASLVAGLTQSPSGFSNTAEEVEWHKENLFEKVIYPKRDEILDELEPLFKAVGINGGVEFYDQDEQKPVVQQLSELDKFIQLGEKLDETYEEIDVQRVEGKAFHINAEKITLNAALKLATVPSSSWQKESSQDTPLFKVRYKYAGDDTGERDFCRRLLAADKVYRIEDIEQASTQRLNPGFGPNGTDTYNILFYKGGPNCKHYWQRHIYMRKDNRPITVTEALNILKELPLEERDENRFEVNDERVAKRMEDQPNHGYINPR